MFVHCWLSFEYVCIYPSTHDDLIVLVGSCNTFAAKSPYSGKSLSENYHTFQIVCIFNTLSSPAITKIRPPLRRRAIIVWNRQPRSFGGLVRQKYFNNRHCIGLNFPTYSKHVQERLWVETPEKAPCCGPWTWLECHVLYGICFKQQFDTRFWVFYNPSPPRMFLSLDLLWEYRIQHGATDPFMSHLATQLGYSAGEFQALQLIVLAAFGVVD